MRGPVLEGCPEHGGACDIADMQASRRQVLQAETGHECVETRTSDVSKPSREQTYKTHVDDVEHDQDSQSGLYISALRSEYAHPRPTA